MGYTLLRTAVGKAIHRVRMGFGALGVLLLLELQLYSKGEKKEEVYFLQEI